MFHAWVDEEDKRNIIRHFQVLQEFAVWFFLTIVFGMGVDVPDIRTVIHYGPSSGFEEYVQESGRGGRRATRYARK